PLGPRGARLVDAVAVDVGLLVGRICSPPSGPGARTWGLRPRATGETAAVGATPDRSARHPAQSGRPGAVEVRPAGRPGLGRRAQRGHRPARPRTGEG